jgi:hypothetical protein
MKPELTGAGGRRQILLNNSMTKEMPSRARPSACFRRHRTAPFTALGVSLCRNYCILRRAGLLSRLWATPPHPAARKTQ